MKKHLIITLFAFTVVGLNAQQSQISVSEGDVFTISQPTSAEFQHVHFPRKNFIIKRGAVPNMKSVYGTQVVVTSVSYDGEGMPRVTLERKDGGKFFRHFRSVDANLASALQSGELVQ